jgi:homogentisate 1,2-dioxygenase
MPMYQSRGEVPAKRHTQFRRPDGRLFVEEVFGLEGFSGNESILYHHNSPCRVKRIHPMEPIGRHPWMPEDHAHRHLRLADFPEGGDPVRDRQTLMYNADISMHYVRPDASMDYFYRNGHADELIFIHEGSGVLRTMFGPIAYRPGDYLLIPRGTIYQFELGSNDRFGSHAVEGPAQSQRHFVMEAPSHFEIPKEFRNNYGMLHEAAPYYHRDMRPPAELETHDERGEFRLMLKVHDSYSLYELDYHPFDVVGWDGYCYPWAFNIMDYEPRAGRIHLPPPTHLTFRGRNFVVCSFVPRLFDWDENAIPIPYHHSNLDSEEVLYYVDGDFMSRKGIDHSSVTLHPSGIPHGPQPGAVEGSLGQTHTDEWAVMVDTFRPLQLARQAETFDQPEYKYSWYTEHDSPVDRELAAGGMSAG